MASIYGNNIKISIFGQSHSSAIGVSIDGLPAGKKIDLKKLQKFLDRRAPGNNEYSTKRKEADVPEILSGLVDDVTCGAPLAAIIKNSNTRSQDYDNIRDVPRPSHADYAAQIKYEGFQDVAGGGHFSGRLTAPLCIAGGICIQILEEEGIKIYSHIKSIYNIEDKSFDYCYMRDADKKILKDSVFPVIDEDKANEMKKAIVDASQEGDSVGGIIECMITGVRAGIGEPIFDGIENRIAQVIYGIPAVKGIEFGNGFECTRLKGSENNDSFCMTDGNVKTMTNNHGGILGGISSGMPIIFRVAFKPTPSIAIEQHSISLEKKEHTKLKIKGRHDPCIVPRAVPCVEAAAAVAIMDMLTKG